MPSETSLEAVLKQDRAIVVGGLIGVAALAWAYLWYEARTMHCAIMDMPMSRPSLQAFGVGQAALLFAMWSFMMVAMMVPSVSPMVLVFAQVNRKRRAQARPFVSTGIFLLGYLAAWTGFSAIATLAQGALHTTALLSSAMMVSSPLLGGALLMAAGLFQLTPIKKVCLVHCRNPLSFLMTEWRDGRRGAFVMGVRHGSYCVGCCWFLMSLLFVAGVMNLAWVALISALVLAEKVLPEAARVSVLSGWGLIGWGAWTVLAT